MFVFLLSDIPSSHLLPPFLPCILSLPLFLSRSLTHTLTHSPCVCAQHFSLFLPPLCSRKRSDEGFPPPVLPPCVPVCLSLSPSLSVSGCVFKMIQSSAFLLMISLPLLLLPPFVLPPSSRDSASRSSSSQLETDRQRELLLPSLPVTDCGISSDCRWKQGLRLRLSFSSFSFLSPCLFADPASLRLLPSPLALRSPSLTHTCSPFSPFLPLPPSLRHPSPSPASRTPERE